METVFLTRPQAFGVVGVLAGGIRIIRLGGIIVSESPSRLSSANRGLRENRARGKTEPKHLPFQISPGQARPDERTTALG